MCLQQMDPEDSEGDERGSCRRWVGRTSGCRGPEGCWEETLGVPRGGCPGEGAGQDTWLREGEPVSRGCRRCRRTWGSWRRAGHMGSG